jgi:exo-beta-1,3-glucanase (GH17 family)
MMERSWLGECGWPTKTSSNDDEVASHEAAGLIMEWAMLQDLLPEQATMRRNLEFR